MSDEIPEECMTLEEQLAERDAQIAKLQATIERVIRVPRVQMRGGARGEHSTFIIHDSELRKALDAAD